jgi:hypothetical protein
MGNSDSNYYWARQTIMPNADYENWVIPKVGESSETVLHQPRDMEDSKNFPLQTENKNNLMKIIYRCPIPAVSEPAFELASGDFLSAIERVM